MESYMRYHVLIVTTSTLMKLAEIRKRGSRSTDSWQRQVHVVQKWHSCTCAEKSPPCRLRGSQSQTARTAPLEEEGTGGYLFMYRRKRNSQIWTLVSMSAPYGL